MRQLGLSGWHGLRGMRVDLTRGSAHSASSVRPLSRFTILRLWSRRCDLASSKAIPPRGGVLDSYFPSVLPLYSKTFPLTTKCPPVITSILDVVANCCTTCWRAPRCESSYPLSFLHVSSMATTSGISSSSDCSPRQLRVVRGEAWRHFCPTMRILFSI